jgi:hypothetical protein
MPMTRRCPHCQQVLPEIRLGVRLPPLKARIFDLIMRGGEDGITARDVLDIAYSETDSVPPNLDTLKSHVHQINEAIEDTGYRIVGGRGGNHRPDRKTCPGVYRLVNKRARRVAA